ncbi:MAG: hypothetical protein KatS3mg056_3191 [Chloroflexus sp.]|nr:MAG: hypothetical protein KatS3mg056_3191 [Chloroflexus sp.]
MLPRQPCSRSSAWPLSTVLVTSMRWMLVTFAAGCLPFVDIKNLDRNEHLLYVQGEYRNPFVSCMVPANSARVAHKPLVQWQSREQRCRTYFLKAVRRTDDHLRCQHTLDWVPCPLIMHVSRSLECGSHAAAPAVLTIRRVAAVDHAGRGD